MKTEEAIKFLKAYRPHVLLAGNIDQIIKLLKRGEKFEKMWGELTTNKINYPISVDKSINNLKQKYFPK